MDPQDEQNTETPAEETPAEETPTEETPNEETPNEEEPKDEDIPVDVLRANLTKANQEAARYRTRLREAEKALEGRKSDEDVQSLLDDLRREHAEETRALLVEAVASKFNLPEALAARLQGATREELEKDAEALAAFAPKPEGGEVPPGDLDGGLNPGNDSDDDDLDPRERVRRIKNRR